MIYFAYGPNLDPVQWALRRPGSPHAAPIGGGGTLRWDARLAYLCLVAALASYRLPGFIALNEPETSLHPDLVGPLARLIGRASERTPGSSKRRFRTFRILYPGYLPGRIPLDAACRPVRQLEQMCIKGLSHDDP